MSERWFKSFYLTLSQDEVEPIMRGHVSFAEVRVLIAIFDHANRETGKAWPSLALLAEKTNLAKSTVVKATKGLEEKGYLRVSRDESKGARKDANRYVTTFGMRGHSSDPRGHIVEPQGSHRRTGTNNQRTSNQYPPTPKGGAAGKVQAPKTVPGTRTTTSQHFNALWADWPKPGAKAEAMRRWAKAANEVGGEGALVMLARQWLTQGHFSEPRYCPGLSVWLNQKRWLDDPPRSQAPAENPWNLR